MVDMTVDYDARFCAVCGRVLEQVGKRSEKHRLYRHASIDEPADHLPVAVREADAPAQVKYRCDFCLDEPITHVLVVDRELGIEELDIAWDTEWAMCPICSQYVIRGDWLNLRRRIFAKYAREYGGMHEETKMRMRVVHRELREAVVMIYVYEGVS